MSVVLVCLLCLAGTVSWLFHHYCHAVVLQIIMHYFSFFPLTHILYRHTNQASVVKRWLVLSTGQNSLQWIMQCGFHNTCAYQAAVVQKMDSTTQRIYLYPVDGAIILLQLLVSLTLIQKIVIYLVDSAIHLLNNWGCCF